MNARRQERPSRILLTVLLSCAVSVCRADEQRSGKYYSASRKMLQWLKVKIDGREMSLPEVLEQYAANHSEMQRVREAIERAKPDIKELEDALKANKKLVAELSSQYQRALKEVNMSQEELRRAVARGVQQERDFQRDARVIDSGSKRAKTVFRRSNSRIAAFPRHPLKVSDSLPATISSGVGSARSSVGMSSGRFRAA